jgi:hypothetical protein
MAGAALSYTTARGLLKQPYKQEFPSFVAERVGLGESVTLSHESGFREFVDVRRRRYSESLDLDRWQAETILNT